MSWQVAILALLALVLLGGVAWYERSRPPSQVVALVAALAALAVAGRVALSPIPNVVPTTDIALLSGYALGGAPGFAVGALAALVSNFWLGQGPWTPWQMAGWGMVGLLGAVLAAPTRTAARPRRPRGRLRARGLRLRRADGLLADGHLRRRAVARPLPGALGARAAVQRRPRRRQRRPRPGRRARRWCGCCCATASRFEFAWASAAAPARAARPRGRGLRRCCVAAPPARRRRRRHAGGARPGRPRRSGRTRVAWLRAAQNADGGFGSAPGRRLQPGDDRLGGPGTGGGRRQPARRSAAAARRRSPTCARRSGEITTTGDIERTILVARGRRARLARASRGRDLVERLLSAARRRRLVGRAGEPDRVRRPRPRRPRGRRRPTRARRPGCAASRNADGGWGFAPRHRERRRQHRGGAAGAGRGGRRPGAIRGGVGYLRARAARAAAASRCPGGARQRPVDRLGGPGPDRGRGRRRGTCARGGRSPLDYLASLQAADGHYRYSRSSDQTPVWVTAPGPAGRRARRRSRSPQVRGASRLEPRRGRRGRPSAPAPAPAAASAAPAAAAGRRRGRRGARRPPRAPARGRPAEAASGDRPAALRADGRRRGRRSRRSAGSRLGLTVIVACGGRARRQSRPASGHARRLCRRAGAPAVN